MKPDLKLFVWEDVLTDYTSGLMVALAHDVAEARELLRDKVGYDSADIDREPTHVVEEPSAFYVSGGG